eukprot:1028434-Pleurochrysis_carterae.AAC.1
MRIFHNFVKNAHRDTEEAPDFGHALFTRAHASSFASFPASHLASRNVESTFWQRIPCSKNELRFTSTRSATRVEKIDKPNVGLAWGRGERG